MSRKARTRKLSGLGFIPIETTDNHRFYVYVKQRKNIWINDTKKHNKVRGKFYWEKAKNLTAYEHYVSSIIPKKKMKDNHSEAFWWLIGRIIADGWMRDRYRYGKTIKDYSVMLCCNKKE